MAVTEVYGDIFQSQCQTLINPVNAHGAMGAGLALAFRNRVPGLYDYYRHLCKTKQFDARKLLRYRWPNTDKQVICLPTKNAWWDPADIDLIRDNLGKLFLHVERLGITSIACPALGCGLGELQYEDVKPIMMELLGAMQVPCEIVLYQKKA